MIVASSAVRHVHHKQGEAAPREAVPADRCRPGRRPQPGPVGGFVGADPRWQDHV